MGQRIDVKLTGRNEKGQGRYSRKEVLISDASTTGTATVTATTTQPSSGEVAASAETSALVNTVDAITTVLVETDLLLPSVKPEASEAPKVNPESVHTTEDGKKVYKGRN